MCQASPTWYKGQLTLLLCWHAQENKARGTTFTRPWRGDQGGWMSVYEGFGIIVWDSQGVSMKSIVQ